MSRKESENKESSISRRSRFGSLWHFVKLAVAGVLAFVLFGPWIFAGILIALLPAYWMWDSVLRPRFSIGIKTELAKGKIDVMLLPDQVVADFVEQEPLRIFRTEAGTGVYVLGEELQLSKVHRISQMEYLADAEILDRLSGPLIEAVAEKAVLEKRLGFEVVRYLEAALEHIKRDVDPKMSKAEWQQLIEAVRKDVRKRNRESLGLPVSKQVEQPAGQSDEGD